MTEYGTVKYYADLFGDIIADIQHDRPHEGDNLIAGFKQAINEWRKYHVNQILELDRIEFNFDDQG